MHSKILLIGTIACNLLILIPHQAHSNQWYGEWGTGVLNNSQTEYSQVKFGELGKKGVLNETFDYSYGGGAIIDSSNYPGSSSTMYGTALLGVGPHLQNLVVEYYLGGAYIQTPDTILGSHLQFAHEVLIGIKDFRNVGVFISIKHLSNAGLVKPNMGRNFIGLGVMF